jgi:hypothetical protein
MVCRSIFLGTKNSEGGFSLKALTLAQSRISCNPRFWKGFVSPRQLPEITLIEITLDGQGNGSFKEVSSSDAEGTTDSGTFSYTVEDDGKVTITMPDSRQFQGAAASDGEIFIIAQIDETLPGILIGIRKTPTPSPAIPALLLD